MLIIILTILQQRSQFFKNARLWICSEMNSSLMIVWEEGEVQFRYYHP